ILNFENNFKTLLIQKSKKHFYFFDKKMINEDSQKLKLQIKQGENQNLTTFQQYLKIKLEKEQNQNFLLSQKQINQTLNNLQQTQQIYETVQKDIQSCLQGKQQKLEIQYYQNQQPYFEKQTNEYQLVRPYTGLSNKEMEIIFQQNPIFTKNEQQKLNQFRISSSTINFYSEFKSQKKKRMEQQITAFVNKVVKQNALKKNSINIENEEKDIHKYIYLNHKKRIQSANLKQFEKSFSSKLGRIKSAQQKPSISYFKNKIKQANLNNESINNAQSLKQSNTDLFQKKQTFFGQMLLEAIRNKKKQQNKNGQNSEFQVKEIQIFQNFTYKSPFPLWLVRNKNYQNLKQTEEFDMNNKIISICKNEYKYKHFCFYLIQQINIQKRPFNRSQFEKDIICMFLQKLPFFKLMPYHMLELISSRLKYCFYNVGQYLCKQGDQGDCMFIIFKGQVEILINGFSINKFFYSGELVGRTALEEDKPRYIQNKKSKNKKIYYQRNADVRVKVPCHILTLNKMDYSQCLTVLQKKIKKKKLKNQNQREQFKMKKLIFQNSYQIYLFLGILVHKKQNVYVKKQRKIFGSKRMFIQGRKFYRQFLYSKKWTFNKSTQYCFRKKEQMANIICRNKLMGKSYLQKEVLMYY
ncbi:hypothetical protein IMG5_176060, partial [Ichthyophthirius multifiliis]